MRIDLPLPSILFPALPRTAPRPLRRAKRVETLCLGQRDAQAVVTKTKQMCKKKRPDLAATFSPLHPAASMLALARPRPHPCNSSTLG